MAEPRAFPLLRPMPTGVAAGETAPPGLGVPRSWADVSAVWMSAALSSSHPGAVVSHVELHDVAEGTNGRARAVLRYRAHPGPESVFVKREGRVVNRLALLALGALESEARLFGARAPLPLEHPVPLAAAVERRRLAAIVVMEDVTLRGARPNTPTTPLPVEEVRSGLLELARLHAAYWDARLAEPMRFLRPWRLRAIWAPVSYASLARALHLLRSRGDAGILPPGADPRTLERGFRGWARLAATGPQTVLHGDPHPGNTYALADGRTGFYDWQLVRTGNWSHDVGYFVISSLDTLNRRAHEHALLADYLRELAGSGAPAPRFDDAWALYRRTPPFGLGTWLHTLSGGGFQPVDQCLAVIERFSAAYADLVTSR